MIKESIKLKIRKATFLAMTIIAYFLSIIYLFGLHDLLGSIVCIFFTFIAFHFLFLDIKNLSIRKFILILLGFFFISLSLFFIFKREINLFIILGVLGFNASIGALFYSLGMISFNSIGYFLRGGYIFSLIITTMYSVALLGMFQEFPFTCQGLNDASNKLFEFVEKPFTLNFNKEKKEDISLSGNKIGNETNNNISGDIKVNPIISKINEFKTTTIDPVLNEQESYSSNMCEMLLNEINSKYGIENFKRSVILLIYLMLYGFIRISFRIMSGIAFIIFKILYWCKVYKIGETIKKVDEIY